MVKQSKINSRNHGIQKASLTKLVKSSDSYTDELISLLSNKPENRRAKQTWEWEQVRRNSNQTREAA